MGYLIKSWVTEGWGDGQVGKRRQKSRPGRQRGVKEWKILGVPTLDLGQLISKKSSPDPTKNSWRPPVLADTHLSAPLR